MRRVLLACLILLAGTACADDALKPFQRGSAKAIADARAGRPFLLALWSVDCVHCRDELALLSRLSRQYPKLEVVLVSTDSMESAPEILKVLREYELPRAERWAFADDFTERLRHEVDPRWRGELPRSYLHAADGTVKGISGKLDDLILSRWLAETKHVRD